DCFSGLDGADQPGDGPRNIDNRFGIREGFERRVQKPARAVWGQMPAIEEDPSGDRGDAQRLRKASTCIMIAGAEEPAVTALHWPRRSLLAPLVPALSPAVPVPVRGRASP